MRKKLLETYGIDEIPAVIEITNSKNMKLVDIERVKMIKDI